MKKIGKLLICGIFAISMIFCLVACDDAKIDDEVKVYADYSEEAYKKLCYIDKMASDRDCLTGKNFEFVQKWIHSELLQAGYQTSDIEYQDVTISKKFKSEKLTDEFKANVILKDAVYATDEKDPSKTTITGKSQNIIVTKKGKSDKQIIIGMHYDGTGTGDNGSGIALGLATAMKFYSIETEYTLKFVFLTGEEYGLFGAQGYVDAMTDEEVANTLYMINMDSLVCGDFCYLYGGVQDNEAKTVTKTEAYDNAMSVASEMGLSFKSNPWSWDKLSPCDEGNEDPEYASPSTGDWSDHAPFAEKGITYLYLEATNWEIPDYTGYGETYLVGMLMNTENDYLEYIENYFPGRPQHHLSMFSKLLNQLLTQNNYGA